MSVNEGQSQVRDVSAEAGRTVEQLREQLRVFEVRCVELYQVILWNNNSLKLKMILSRVESDLWAQQVSFQERSGVAALSRMVSHSHSHTAIKDRRIQGLSSAAPCANDFWVFSPPGNILFHKWLQHSV